MKKLYIILIVSILIIGTTSLTLFHENQSQTDQMSAGKKEEEKIIALIEKQEQKAPTVSVKKPETRTPGFSKETSEGGTLLLKTYGPEDIKAGRDFNKQENGESAIWAKAENVTPTTVLVLNHQPLVSFPHPYAKLIAAFVPPKFYASPGQYPLYLMDTRTNKKSNELKFTVQ